MSADEEDGRDEAVRRHVRAVLDHVEAGVVSLLALDTPQLAGVAAAFTLAAGLVTWLLCCCGGGAGQKEGGPGQRQAGVTGNPDEEDTDGDMVGGNRFRKRDKIAFMGRKVYKNAKVSSRQ